MIKPNDEHKRILSDIRSGKQYSALWQINAFRELLEWGFIEVKVTPRGQSTIGQERPA